MDPEDMQDNASNPPIAQEQEGAQETQPAAETPKEDKRFDGLQKRIDELVRQNHEKDERLMQLLASVAANNTHPQVVAPAPHPEVEIDPETRKTLDAYMAPIKQRYEAEISAARLAAEEARFGAAAQGQDPRVAARAKELYSNWQRSGKTGWSPEDAITFARGELVVKDQSLATGARNERERFNSSGTPVLTQQATPPPLMQNGPAPLPTNFEELSPDDQLALLEKRGVGDMPF